MSAELPLGQEQAAPLTCSLRSRPFFFGLRRFASRACRSIRCATARLCFAERLTVGRFELTHFARMGGVTVFSRYAERAGAALSVTRHYKYTLSSSDIAVCIGSASRSIVQVYQATGIWNRAGVSRSALLLLHFWRRERKAEPTTMRSVLLSMRQGPM